MDSLALGHRLRVHRIAAGLSLRELSVRLTVSAQALSQYETGQTRPRIEVLQALARSLGTSVEQLDRAPESIRLGSVRIWHPTQRNQKTLGRARGTLLALAERSLALEQMLGGAFPPPSLPLMTEVRLIRDPEDAEGLAQDVRRRWGLGTGPLPKLVSLFEARGVRVFDLLYGEDSHGFNACSAFVSSSSGSWTDFPVVLLNGTLWGEQKRFALCHELAHIILPSPVYFVLTESVRDRLADWFAGALLLPASSLREQLGRKRRTLSWYELGEIKRQFGISFQAITKRCLETEIIGREPYRDLMMEYRRLGWRDAPYREDLAMPPRTESSTRLKRLALRAVAERMMDAREAATLLDVQREDINRWLAPPERSGVSA